MTYSVMSVGISIATLLLTLTALVKTHENTGKQVLIHVCIYINRYLFPPRAAGYEHLDAALHHYDTLHTDHVNHSYSSSSPSLQHRHVQFYTLGRYVQAMQTYIRHPTIINDVYASWSLK